MILNEGRKNQKGKRNIKVKSRTHKRNVKWKKSRECFNFLLLYVCSLFHFHPLTHPCREKCQSRVKILNPYLTTIWRLQNVKFSSLLLWTADHSSNVLLTVEYYRSVLENTAKFPYPFPLSSHLKILRTEKWKIYWKYYAMLKLN